MLQCYWQHTSGETYAVEIDDDGMIVASCGPLHYSEITKENLALMHYNVEDLQWLQDHEKEFHLKEV